MHHTVNTIGMYLYYALFTACVVALSAFLLGAAYIVVDEVLTDIRIRRGENLQRFESVRHH